jgi:hypothetical protein
MLYVVVLRREREELSTIMARIREWLDKQRCEPDTFRCTNDEKGMMCRLEFKVESEAVACAEAFRGEVTAIGSKSAE